MDVTVEPNTKLNPNSNPKPYPSHNIRKYYPHLHFIWLVGASSMASMCQVSSLSKSTLQVHTVGYD